MRAVAGAGADGQVYWVEVRAGRVPRVSLASAPIEVGPALKQQLYDKVPTVVLTSATLSRRRHRRASATSRTGSACDGATPCNSAARSTSATQVGAAPVPRHARPVRPARRLRGGGAGRRSRSTSSGAAAGRSCCSPATQFLQQRGGRSCGRGSPGTATRSSARATACRARRCSSSSATRRQGGAVRRGQLLAGRGRAGRGAVERHHHQAAVRGAGPAADGGPAGGDRGGGRQPVHGLPGAAGGHQAEAGVRPADPHAPPTRAWWSSSTRGC